MTGMAVYDNWKRNNTKRKEEKNPPREKKENFLPRFFFSAKKRRMLQKAFLEVPICTIAYKSIFFLWRGPSK
jgi:hypothetical protein